MGATLWVPATPPPPPRCCACLGTSGVALGRGGQCCVGPILIRDRPSLLEPPSVLPPVLCTHLQAICAEGGFKGAIPGRVRALLFHGMQSQAPCLLEVLSDLRFLECACVAGSAFPLMTALATVSERNPVAKRKLTEYYDMMLVHLPRMRPGCRRCYWAPGHGRGREDGGLRTAVTVREAGP